MARFDYHRDLKEAENRVNWLRESYIAAQQHNCFRVADSIAEELVEAEAELEKLYSLR